MPQLTLPIRPDGLLLEVTFGLPGNVLAAAQAAGQQAPPGKAVLALIDTGADATSISSAVVAQFGLTSFKQFSMGTASGSANVNAYRVSLCIFGPQGATGAAFVRDVWTATEFIQPLPGIDALLGMDFIREVHLAIDGPRGEFTITF